MFRQTLRALSLFRVDTGLSGKRVLVTGASGGIGSACARAFVAEGSRVALHFHQGRDRAEALSEELGGAPILEMSQSQALGVLVVGTSLAMLFALARSAH